MYNPKAVLILLRLSIASVFLYAAIASTLAPYNWIGYIPQFLRNIFPGNILLGFFSLYELVLSVWILSRKKTFYAAILAAATLIGIIVSNISQADILFRDFAIFFAALALAVATLEGKNRRLSTS